MLKVENSRIKLKLKRVATAAGHLEGMDDEDRLALDMDDLDFADVKDFILVGGTLLILPAPLHQPTLPPHHQAQSRSFQGPRTPSRSALRRPSRTPMGLSTNLLSATSGKGLLPSLIPIAHAFTLPSSLDS